MEFKLDGIDGSNATKQERSDPNQDGGGCNKMGKRGGELEVMRSEDNDKQQILSFSGNSNNFKAGDDVTLASDQNGSSFYNHHFPSSNHPSNNSAPSFIGGMKGSFTGIKGPFTPAQWIELEHQAMIYKYFIANVPVPSNLLIPIRKALQSAVFSGFSIGSFPPHSYGWGAFHLGYSGKTDPEPGRCRRTDGKKWRCSRDAVFDQKYCERHINRGRHRSRKPVEGLTGQAASAAATTTKVVPLGGGVSDGGGATGQHQIPNASTDPITERLVDQQGSKSQMSYTESSVSEFGIVSKDSLLNPSQKSSYMLEFNDQKHQESLPIDLKSDWTQLSMSIPMSSPNQEMVSVAISSQRLSGGFDPSSEMGLGIGTQQNCWITRVHGNSMGGPLGEVLLNNNTSNGETEDERWGGSHQVMSSPTGILHNSTFVSRSNSNSGGSPLGPV